MNTDTILSLIEDIDLAKVRRNSRDSESKKTKKWKKED